MKVHPMLPQSEFGRVEAKQGAWMERPIGVSAMKSWLSQK